MLLEWIGYPSEQRRLQTIFFDRHRHETFPDSSLDRVVLFPGAISTLRLEHVPHKVRCITTMMLYHYATAVAKKNYS